MEVGANALLVGKKTKEAEKSKAAPAKAKGGTGKRNTYMFCLFVSLCGWARVTRLASTFVSVKVLRGVSDE